MTSNEYRDYINSCSDIGKLKKEIKLITLLLSDEHLALHQVIDFSNKLIVVQNRVDRLEYVDLIEE